MRERSSGKEFEVDAGLRWTLVAGTSTCADGEGFSGPVWGVMARGNDCSCSGACVGALLWQTGLGNGAPSSVLPGCSEPSLSGLVSPGAGLQWTLQCLLRTAERVKVLPHVLQM